MDVRLVIDQQARIGEAPIWSADEQCLYWVDIENHLLFRYDPVSGQNEAFDVGRQVTTVVPVATGTVLLGVKEGIAYFDIWTQKMKVLHELDTDRPNNRCNDGKCDPAGRFWVGTQDNELEDGAGSMYCLEPDGTVRRMLEGLKNPNGIVWSRDHPTMFFTDTYTMRVDAYDYDHASGEVTNRRAAVVIPNEFGVPDGMTQDVNGNLWIGHFFGSCVTHWNPFTGELLGRIDVPARNVTACWFGGADLQTLYITTARDHTSAEELERFPNAGGLFAVDLPVKGVPGDRYGGAV